MPDETGPPRRQTHRRSGSLRGGSKENKNDGRRLASPPAAGAVAAGAAAPLFKGALAPVLGGRRQHRASSSANRVAREPGQRREGRHRQHDHAGEGEGERPATAETARIERRQQDDGGSEEESPHGGGAPHGARRGNRPRLQAPNGRRGAELRTGVVVTPPAGGHPGPRPAGLGEGVVGGTKWARRGTTVTGGASRATTTDHASPLVHPETKILP